MIPKLALHDPRWLDLGGVTADEVGALLEQMASTAATGTGDEWRRTWTQLTEGLMDDGVVSDGTYAALPHLVEAAAALPPGQTVDFWVDMGFIMTADYMPPVPAYLAAGFSAALRLAERAATRSLLVAGAPARRYAHLALSCVAFTGHHIGPALQRLPDSQDSELLLVCPGCESDTEIPEFFVNPVRPPVEAPELPDPAPVRRAEHPWGEVAAALGQETPGEGWAPFLRVAREVAAAGVPSQSPGQAVLCLVAGLVAIKGAPEQAGEDWGRQLMSLTGYFRCWECELTWTIADGLVDNPDGARSLGPLAEAWTDSGWPAATGETASANGTRGAATRFRREGTALLAADGTLHSRIAVLSDSPPGSSEGVNSLAVVSRPGRPTLVAGAGDTGTVCLWDAADGRLVHGPLPGHPDGIRSMTALPLADGRVLLASGGDTGTIAVWDPGTGRPVREPAGNWPGGVTGMCAATVPDGETLLVTATPRGAVRLWNPDTGAAVGRLNPYGSPIRSIAAIPVSAGHTLIAAADTAGRVHMWDPAVDDPWEPGAAVQLSGRALDEGEHRAAAVAAVPTPDGTLLATGDDGGVVMLWDPATGRPVGDALPSSTGTAGIPAITAAMPYGGRTVLVVGNRWGRNLRIWEPESGTVRHIAVDVAITCLAIAGPDLIVGHDRGVLRLPLTRQ